MEMIRSVIGPSFELFWEALERPRLDLLEYKVDNDPLAVTHLGVTDSYDLLAERVPYIYSDGPIDSEVRVDTTGFNLFVFLRECDLPTPPHSKLIFKIEGRLYKMAEKDPNYIFGLFEFKLGRAD